VPGQPQVGGGQRSRGGGSKGRREEGVIDASPQGGGSGWRRGRGLRWTQPGRESILLLRMVNALKWPRNDAGWTFNDSSYMFLTRICLASAVTFFWTRKRSLRQTCSCSWSLRVGASFVLVYLRSFASSQEFALWLRILSVPLSEVNWFVCCRIMACR
jgi:hypothetical protein